MISRISFMGLGKLGLPLATNFGKNGISVLAIDINKKNIELLQNKKAPFFEPNLQENIDLSADNVKYSLTAEYLFDTDATLILVNTPSKEDGSFSNEYIFSCLKSACENLKLAKKTKHDFIISSTVMPGSFEKFISYIENEMNWSLNKDFSLAYVPDFVALGNVIKDFENPDMLVVGCSNKQFGREVEELYKKQIKNNCKSVFLSLEETEIAKVALNAYICTKISFANFLANICEKTKNTNVDNITSAIGLDKRISPYYFKGGLSFGGTCFPRDTWAFIKVSENMGLNAVHVKAAQDINVVQDKLLLEKVLNVNKKSISILGLGFKNNTPVITESASIKLIEKLVELGYIIHVHDPVEEAMSNTKIMFGDKLVYHKSFMDCFESNDFTVIANPYKQFKELELHVKASHTIIDCWRAYNFTNCKVINLGIK